MHLHTCLCRGLLHTVLYCTLILKPSPRVLIPFLVVQVREKLSGTTEHAPSEGEPRAPSPSMAIPGNPLLLALLLFPCYMVPSASPTTTAYSISSAPVPLVHRCPLQVLLPLRVLPHWRALHGQETRGPYPLRGIRGQHQQPPPTSVVYFNRHSDEGPTGAPARGPGGPGEGDGGPRVDGFSGMMHELEHMRAEELAREMVSDLMLQLPESEGYGGAHPVRSDWGGGHGLGTSGETSVEALCASLGPGSC